MPASFGLSVSEMLSTIDYPDRPMDSASYLTKEDVGELLAIASKEINIRKKILSINNKPNSEKCGDATTIQR